MDPHEQLDGHRSHDAASHGSAANQPSDVPVAAAAVDPDQHPSSCPPLIQPVVPSQEPPERSSSEDPPSEGQKRKRTGSVGNEDPRSKGVGSESEQSFGIAKYDQMRRTLRKFMGRVSTIPTWGENWQSHTTNVRKGAVIEIPYFEHVKNLANNDQGRPGDLNWAPAIHGFTLVTHHLAAVEKNPVRGGMLVHLLTEFDDDALSLLRRETYLDRDTSDFRPKLDNLLHVVALDSNGPLVSEPQCFDNGVRLNWRSTNGVAPPINKSSFMYVDEHARLVNPATLCMVGALAEDGDFSVLRSARVALTNEVDEDDAREIKRRREDRTRDPIGFALSLMADSLANLPRAPSPAASDSSQESGPYTQRYMYENRQHEFRSPPRNPDPRPLAPSDYTQDNQPRTPRSWAAYGHYCAMFSPGMGPQYSDFMMINYPECPFNLNSRSPSPYEDREGEEGSPPFNHNSRSPSPYEDSEGEEGSSPYRRGTDHEENTQYEDFLQDHPDGEFFE